MKSKIQKAILGLVSLGFLFVGSIPSAYADNGWHRGWQNRGRVVQRRAPIRRPYFYRPYYRNRYYFSPPVRYYGDVVWYDNDPGWSIRFDSEGDVGFSAQW